MKGLKPKLLEPLLEKYRYLIDSFTWIPFDLSKIDHLRIRKMEVSNFVDRTFETNVYGVQPTIFETSNKEFINADCSGIIRKLYKQSETYQVGISSFIPFQDRREVALKTFSQI